MSSAGSVPGQVDTSGPGSGLPSSSPRKRISVNDVAPSQSVAVPAATMAPSSWTSTSVADVNAGPRADVTTPLSPKLRSSLPVGSRRKSVQPFCDGWFGSGQGG